MHYISYCTNKSEDFSDKNKETPDFMGIKTKTPRETMPT